MFPWPRNVLRLFAVSPGILPVLFSSIVRAQPVRDPAGADVLFNHGKELLRAGQWGEACAKFGASMLLDPAVGTLLKLAKCDEHEGKLASALHDYTAALSLNRQKPDATAERRAQVERYAQDALASLEPRVPKIRVVVDRPPLGLEVSRGGEALPPAAWGEPLPINPGHVEFVASAPGYETWRSNVFLEEGGSAVVVIAMRPLDPPASAIPSAAASPPKDSALPSSVGPYSDAAGPRAPSNGGRRTTAIALGIAGGVALAVAGLLGLETLSEVDAASRDRNCDANFQCNRQGVNKLNDASSLQTGAFVALGIGVGLLGTAATLWVTTPARHAATLLPIAVGVNASGAVVRGSW